MHIYFFLPMPLLSFRPCQCLFVGSYDSCRSMMAWCTFGRFSCFSKCKKQERISKSSTQDEYHAMSSACFDILWWPSIWTLGFLKSLLLLYADDTSAVQIVSNPVFIECTKHIGVDCHAIRDEWIQMEDYYSSKCPVQFTLYVPKQWPHHAVTGVRQPQGTPPDTITHIYQWMCFS